MTVPTLTKSAAERLEVLTSVLSHLDARSSVDREIHDRLTAQERPTLEPRVLIPDPEEGEPLEAMQRAALRTLMHAGRHLEAVKRGDDYGEWAVRFNTFYRALELTRFVTRRIKERGAL